MKRSEVEKKRKELKIVAAMPVSMWRNSLQIAEIPEEVIGIVLRRGRMTAADEYLQSLVAPSRPRARRAPDAPVHLEPVTLRRFGVEIECVGATRDAIIRECRQRGLAIFSEAYNHRDGGNHKIVSDASLRGENANEVVTRPLSELEELRILLYALKAAGARVNKSCGLHVHIDAADLNIVQAVNIINNYYYMRHLINASLPASRTNNRYCAVKSYTDLVGRDNWYLTLDAFADAVCDRYVAVNIRAYKRHGTIEFRQHQGSLNYEKIKNWILFLQSLFEWSKNNELRSDVTDRNDPRLAGLDINRLRVRP